MVISKERYGARRDGIQTTNKRYARQKDVQDKNASTHTHAGRNERRLRSCTAHVIVPQVDISQGCIVNAEDITFMAACAE